MRTKKQVMGMAIALLLAAPAALPQMETQAKAAPVALSREAATLHVGEKLQLKLRGTKKKITWSTSSKAAASVSKNGMVTGKKPGKAVIKAAVKAGTNKVKAYKCRIQVVETEKAAAGMDGAFSCADSVTVTKELRAIFDKALDGFGGVDYEPVAFLGEQVAAGTNYSFLCKATVVYPGAEPSYVRMDINEDPEGNVTILSVEDVIL